MNEHISERAETNPASPDNDILDKRGACAYLKKSLSGLNECMAGGRLPYFKLGRSVRFSRRMLWEHLNEKCLVTGRRSRRAA